MKTRPRIIFEKWFNEPVDEYFEILNENFCLSEVYSAKEANFLQAINVEWK